jgi:hypothetical protein
MIALILLGMHNRTPEAYLTAVHRILFRGEIYAGSQKNARPRSIYVLWPTCNEKRDTLTRNYHHASHWYDWQLTYLQSILEADDDGWLENAFEFGVLHSVNVARHQGERAVWLSGIVDQAVWPKVFEHIHTSSQALV